MFFSRAGAELSVLCGRFFRVRDTTPLSALSEPTRLRSCQPTCGATGEDVVNINVIF